VADVAEHCARILVRFPEPPHVASHELQADHMLAEKSKHSTIDAIVDGNKEHNVT
jgi:hypothetical protein